MGNDVGLFKEGYSTWLSSRPQNQPHSWSAVYMYVYFSFFVKPSRIGLELEPWFLPRFPVHSFPTGVFLWQVFSGLRLTVFVL